MGMAVAFNSADGSSHRMTYHFAAKLVLLIITQTLQVLDRRLALKIKYDA